MLLLLDSALLVRNPLIIAFVGHGCLTRYSVQEEGVVLWMLGSPVLLILRKPLVGGVDHDVHVSVADVV